MRIYMKEFFAHTDIRLMSLLLLLGIGYLLPDLLHGITWLTILIGMLTYVLSEYTIHRFLFHMKPPKNQFLLKMIKRLHYDHHVKPNDLKLLFLPVWYSLPLMIVPVAIVYWITQNWSLTIAYWAGIISFLLYYEWIHYVAHRPIRPITPWGRYMKKVHLWHHYKNENYWYGVTNPMLDLVMGTYKDEKTVEKSETARNLEQ